MREYLTEEREWWLLQLHTSRSISSRAISSRIDCALDANSLKKNPIFFPPPWIMIRMPPRLLPETPSRVTSHSAPFHRKVQLFKTTTKKSSCSQSNVRPQIPQETALLGLSEVQVAPVHKESPAIATALSCTDGPCSSFILYILHKRWARSFVSFAPTGVSVEPPRWFWA